MASVAAHTPPGMQEQPSEVGVTKLQGCCCTRSHLADTGSEEKAVLLGVELAIKLSAVNTSRLDNQHTNMNTHVLHKHGLLLMNVVHKHA
jgi:hypothetical protein